MATPLGKDVTAPGGRARPAPKLKCPRCGLVAEGLRCLRCDAVKVTGCGGSCAGCRAGCDALQKG